MAKRATGGAKLVDRIAASALSRIDETAASERPAWWWLLFAPGKVILWLQYMWPERISDVFGTSRRRNVPLVQMLYSFLFYLGILALGWFILSPGR